MECQTNLIYSLASIRGAGIQLPQWQHGTNKIKACNCIFHCHIEAEFGRLQPSSG